MKPLDFIGAIELAYNSSKADDAVWLDDLTRTIAPAFSTRFPTSSFVYEVVGDEAVVSNFRSFGDGAYTIEQFQKQHELGSKVHPTRVAYECDMFTLLSRVVGPETAAKTIAAVGMTGDDALGLRANNTSRQGVVFTTHVDRGHRIRNRSIWLRFAAHVGSALRLRQRAREATMTADEAVAVLSPTGRLEHARETNTAVVLDARDELAVAAKDMDRARGKMRRLDPEQASSLWRAMVRGEWTLVDWIDHDGKRFLLAHENKIPALEANNRRTALTPREEQVVACAAMGHSNKLIAYDLGLSTGTVSVILARAAKKLGVSGRVALIRAFRETPAS